MSNLELQFIRKANQYLISKNKNEIPALNFIRFLAIFLIVVFHFHHGLYLARIFNYEQISNFYYLFYNLDSGVDLFFILSGYLISNLIERSRLNRNNLFIFYFKRALRIFPGYYFFILCVIILGFIYDTKIIFSKFVYDIFFISNFVNGNIFFSWSLSCEEQFYVVFPLILLFFTSKLTNKHRIFFYLLSYSLIIILKWMIVNHESLNSFFIIDRLRFDSILIGILIKEFIQIYKQKLECFSPIKMQILLVMGIVFFFIFHSIDWMGWAFRYNLFQLSYCLIFLPLIYIHTKFSNYLFNLSLVRIIAKLSFGIYLWHIISSKVLSSIFSPNFIYSNYDSMIFYLKIFWIFIVWNLITVLFCYLIFVFVEYPFLQWKDNLNLRTI